MSSQPTQLITTSGRRRRTYCVTDVDLFQSTSPGLGTNRLNASRSSSCSMALPIALLASVNNSFNDITPLHVRIRNHLFYPLHHADSKCLRQCRTASCKTIACRQNVIHISSFNGNRCTGCSE